jgi:hypothetical protein
MSDPKVFYRELDAFLAKIRIDDTRHEFLPFIQSELERNFGEKLRFGNGRLYQQKAKELVLVYPEEAKKNPYWAKTLDIENRVVQLAYTNRSYIYDFIPYNNIFSTDKTYDTISIGIWLHSPECQWLMVFELMDGWSREEISLFLNSVRTSVNYRLFAKAIGGHLDQAVQIQKSLLPKKPLKVEGYQIYGRSKPADLVGGDFYDYFNYDDTNFGIAIGDASGHGFPAALLVRDVVIGLRMGLATDMRLVHTIEKLNDVIQRSTYSTNFVSLFVGEIESDGHLFYVNAGHIPPFIITKDGQEDLKPTGITLGFLPDTKLNRGYAYIPTNSIMVLLTDGILERENAKEEMFEMEKLKKLVRDNFEKSAEEIVTAIYKAVYEFGEKRPWDDDATVVVVKRLNGAKQNLTA